MTGIDLEQRHNVDERSEPQTAAARNDGVTVKRDDQRPRAHRRPGLKVVPQPADRN